jgi:uncharacterized sodium:solute symporter family permease YidK
MSCTDSLVLLDVSAALAKMRNFTIGILLGLCLVAPLIGSGETEGDEARWALLLFCMVALVAVALHVLRRTRSSRQRRTALRARQSR